MSERVTSSGRVTDHSVARPDALVERFAVLAPTEFVGWAQQRAHADAVIDRIAARVTGDDHVVAGLQRVARDALAGERARATPLDAQRCITPFSSGAIT